MKIRNYAYAALAVIALAGCAPEYDTDKLPIIIEPEPEITYNGSGKLLYGEEHTPMTSTYSWSAEKETITLTFDVDLDEYAANKAWEIGHFYLDGASISDFLGLTGTGDINDDINKLADFEYFYPVEPDGTPGEKWTSYAPGQWVDKDGSATSWSDGKMYWFYNFGENKSEDHYTEGLLCVGTNPENIADLDGVTVTSKAKIGDKDFIVNVTYHSEYPTKGEGTIGANSYSWELTDEAFNVVANLSKANLDDSWGALGFPINTKYVNEYYDITIEDLTFEDFYPVDSEGTPGEKWTSYVPGQWFTAEGNPSGSDGVAFWQYYTGETHDFNLTNLFYIGKNPGGNEAKEVGDSYVSKAKLAGHDMIVTVNIID